MILTGEDRRAIDEAFPSAALPNIIFAWISPFRLISMSRKEITLFFPTSNLNRSQWPRCLRHGSTVARLLGLRVRIPPGSWISVYCECCVLSGKSLCDGTITRPEEPTECVCG
jgi:hypothetical protein